MDSINNAPNLGGDAWLELQAFKTRQINRREKLNRHKDLINGIPGSSLSLAHLSGSSSSSIYNNSSNNTSFNASNEINANHLVNNRNIATDQARPHSYELGADRRNESQEQIEDLNNKSDHSRALNLSESLTTSDRSDRSDRYCDNSSSSPSNRANHRTLIEVECLLLLKLCDVALKLPIDSRNLLRSITKVRGFEKTTMGIVENLLQKFAHQELIIIEEPSTAVLSRGEIASGQEHDEVCTYVVSADHTKLVEFNKAFSTSDSIRALLSDEYNSRNSHEETDLFVTRSLQSRDSARTGVTETQSIGKKSPQSGTRNSQDTQLSHRHDHEQAQSSNQRNSTHISKKHPTAGEDVEKLLSLSSTRERENKKLGEELLELLSKPTAKERNLLERFRSADGYQVQEFCPKGTKDECRRNGDGVQACDKLHFKKILAKHTEESLGDCSFLNTCFHMDSCKYVHYEVDYDDKQIKRDKKHKTRQQSSFLPEGTDALCLQETTDSCQGASTGGKLINDRIKPTCNNVGLKQVSTSKQVSRFTLSAEEQVQIDVRNRKRFKTVLYPPQWIQCDLRYFDMSLLGKFSVVMADPPWDIHMELPYGTMSDDEMRKLNVPALQDEGVIFLWVTGRAMELGRECLALWGYERCDEIIWVKTNQLQRIIRTGRTGHWLNHGKEHCLVGIKGNPSDMNRGLDCDIIVAEVRATSHKPDEIYGIIERLSPGTRKIELFGRAHNVQPNWITLGNQLDGVRLVEPSLIEAFKKQNLPYQTSD